MKNKITKSRIMAVIAVLCGFSASFTYLIGDIGILEIVLLILSGFFAYTAIQWKGALIVAAISVFNSLMGCMLYADYEKPWEWLMEVIFAVMGCYSYFLVGMVGALIAFLFQRGLDKDPDAPRSNRPVRAAMVAGGVIIVAMAAEFIMLFSGDPVLYIKGRRQADRYVSQTYPDAVYQSCYYDFHFSRYEFDYQIDKPSNDSFTIRLMWNTPIAPLSWFQMPELTDGWREQKIYRLEEQLEKQIEPAAEQILARQYDFTSGDQYYSNVQIRNVPDDADLDAAFEPSRLPGEVVVWYDSNTDSSATFSAAQTLARELTEGGYRVDAFDVSFEEDFYENIPVGSLLSAKSFDDLANYRKKEFED